MDREFVTALAFSSLEMFSKTCFSLLFGCNEKRRAITKHDPTGSVSITSWSFHWSGASR